MSEWEFSAMIEEDGDLGLEWYKDKGNVVTVCFNSVAGCINWAALIDGVSHHGYVGDRSVRSAPSAAQGVEHGK